jgi:hypothetical protein
MPLPDWFWDDDEPLFDLTWLRDATKRANFAMVYGSPSKDSPPMAGGIPAGQLTMGYGSMSSGKSTNYSPTGRMNPGNHVTMQHLKKRTYVPGNTPPMNFKLDYAHIEMETIKRLIDSDVMTKEKALELLNASS